MASILEPAHWTWLILGLAMLALELLAPFAFFLWLGVAALVTAAAAFAAPLHWQAQCLLFSALSVLSIGLSRRYLVKRQTRSELPNLNRRAQQCIGRTFILTEAIDSGNGKISVDDASWRVAGPVLPRGAAVTVVGCEGAVLTVIEQG